jgi:serine/threonine-protein kinase
MPYIAGESLRHRMKREGPLGVDMVVRTGCEIADALDYAHRAGVVHRDIKPENILLQGGHAFVADFGIGTALQQAGRDRLTQTGIVVGTPRYMSPEQVESVVVDGRADIYSLGCMLYEMLAGRPPYDGPTLVAIFARRARAGPTPLRDLRPDVPAGVEQVVLKAMANDVADRFSTGEELIERLRASPTANVAAVHGREHRPRSIAVLPFTNTSAEPDTEYFSDGMTEELINALAQLPSLKVAARTSSFAFKGTNIDLRRVGETLGVNTVLEGSVRQSGKRLRVTARLIDLPDGFQLWSERYDRELTDVFTIQDEIASSIAQQLKVQLTPERAGAPLVRRGTQDLEAYHMYLRGRFFWERRELQKAMVSFEQASARDPAYAPPLAGLADGYTLLGYYGFIPAPAACARATAAAERAVAADSSLADAHLAAGGVNWLFNYDVQLAEAEFRRAISLDPRSAFAHTILAYFHGVMGNLDGLQFHGRQALELDVLSGHVARLVGLGHVFAGQHEAGIALCEAAVQLDPGAVSTYSLGFACALQGRHDDAIRELRRAIEMLPAPLYLLTLGYAYALAGRTQDAQNIIAQLEAKGLDPYCVWIHATLRHDDEVFRQLELIFQQRHPLGMYFAHWPGWAQLRSDARYTATVRKAGLLHLLPESG